MAATDAKAIAVKAAALRITFPILDADGDLVTGATGLDSEVSIDGGTFADCTNEATEIATSSGVYFLDLTAAEMNGDTIAVIVKTSTAGAKTTPMVIYTAARNINDLAFPTTTGRSIDVTATGEVGLDFANTAGTLDSTDITSVGAVATGGITAGSFAAGAIDAAAIATDAIGSAELAATAVTEIVNGVLDEATSGHVTAGTVGKAIGDTVAAVDTEVAAIKAKTDNLPAAPAATGDIPTAAAVADAVWDEATLGHTTAGTFGEQVKTDVDAILADTGTDGVVVATSNDKTGYALSAAGVDAILDESLTELAAVPAAAPTLRAAVQWLFQMARNKVTTSSTQMKVHNDAGTVVGTATVSDDGTTFERSKHA